MVSLHSFSGYVIVLVPEESLVYMGGDCFRRAVVAIPSPLARECHVPV